MEKIPLKHIAFIMDGNGRWAKSRGLPREFGHEAGAETLKKIIDYCGRIGIDSITVYAFSTENWKRPKEEVDAIFRLMDRYIGEFSRKFSNSDIRIVFIGEKDNIPKTLRDEMDHLQDITAHKGKTLYIAFNYGGRAEICSTVNSLISRGYTHITEKDISDNIYTHESPDPDMIIRTGGEHRLSNFLMWQSAYSELYIIDTLWPDLTPDDVDKAVSEYMRRNRRFGGL